MSINYRPEPTGISVYSTGLAEFLAARGHQVSVYTAFPYYPAWKKRQCDMRRMFSSETIAGVRVFRNYIYVPQRPTALLRILHELSFSLTVCLRYLLSPSADLTVVVTPPLLAGFLITACARLKRSRTVLHVQDLQPDAAIDLGMVAPGRLTKILFAIEWATYNLATRVSTISNAMLNKIKSKEIPPAKTLLFKNWADDALVQPLSYEHSLRNEWGLDNSFVVLYSGNMGAKQGLGTLLEVASLMKGEVSVKFVVVGDGGEKPKLVNEATELGLTNIVFKSPVPSDLLGRLLAIASVSIISQKTGIDDLVLPSKFGNLLASKRPMIVCTNADSELATIVTTINCGIVVPPENANAIVQAIRRLKNNSKLFATMAENGERYAHSQLRKDLILDNFAQFLEELAR